MPVALENLFAEELACGVHHVIAKESKDGAIYLWGATAPAPPPHQQEGEGEGERARGCDGSTSSGRTW